MIFVCYSGLLLICHHFWVGGAGQLGSFISIVNGENGNGQGKSVAIRPAMNGATAEIDCRSAIDGKCRADVNGWLQSNTFHYSQFSNLPELIREKHRQGLTISLCIPALNEEKTIGREVALFKSELQDRYPLLDEIAVIDSGSTDRTLATAAAAGADVYLAADILPEMGHRQGKGENLWKAVYQLRGDIIVYVDADIRNIRRRFAYGLAAPLIFRPEIKYVKAFYDRSADPADGSRPSGGGG